MKHLHIALLATCLCAALPARAIPLDLAALDSESHRTIDYFEVSVAGPDTAWKAWMSAPEAARLDLPAGSYRIRLAAAAYQPLEASLLLEPGGASRLRFYLDPIAARPLPAPLAGRCLVEGWVLDEAGLPLADVRIGDEDHTTRSDARGYFLLDLPQRSDGARSLRFDAPGRGSLVKTDLLCWPGGVWRIHAQLGTTARTASEWSYPLDADGLPAAAYPPADMGSATASRQVQTGDSACAVPSSIRVGLDCPTGGCSFGAFNCATVGVFSLTYYTQAVLAHEWIGSWGNLPGGMNSLRAGAVAVRSYAAWYVDHPLTSTYDICSTTCCQVFVNATSSLTNQAVIETEGWFLLADGSAARAEYSAENNHLAPACFNTTYPNSPCTDGQFAESNNNSLCFDDPTGQGKRLWGHGRGMSQYGSARWASGLDLTGPCTPGTGTAHGQGTRDWQGILTLYYPTYALTNCGDADPGFTCDSAIVLACGQTYQGPASDRPSYVERYGCNNWTETGPERVHAITLAADVRLTATISNFSGDLDVYILGSCNPDDCRGTVFSSQAVYDEARADSTYYLLVDSDDGSNSAYTLSVGCEAASAAALPLIAGLVLAPNPATDWLDARWEQPLHHALRWTLCDPQGRVLAADTWAAGTLFHRWDLRAWPAGIYLLEIGDATARTYHRVVHLKN
ncbi:MAG: hypothetical protein OHK0039_09490 [Bacteroidia bacterium]